MTRIDHFLGGEAGLRPTDAAVALIVVDGARYLMQLRDQSPGIFYPEHWGVFGGALDPGEAVESALRRELLEELGYVLTSPPRYFTEFTFDFSYAGQTKVLRRYYEVHVRGADVDQMVLGEGQRLAAFAPHDILLRPRVVPYDAYAIWMHATRNLIWSGQS